MPPSSKFRPWRRNYAWGMIVLLAGLATSWWATLMGHPNVGTFFAIGFTYSGGVRIWRGARRERGMLVESEAVERSRTMLAPKGYKIEADISAERIGNIDMIVSPSWTQASYVVEIKSFPGLIQRRYGLTIIRNYFSQWRAAKQVRGQCCHMGEWHFPVLWMPVSKLQTCFSYQGILVVNGDVDLLERAIQWFDETVKLPMVIAFKSEPPIEYRQYVQGLGFKYNPENWEWNGHICKGQFGAVAQQLAPANGCAKFLARDR